MTYYEWYKSAGICVRCHKENVAPGRVKCFDCLEKDKIKAEKWRENHPEYAKMYYARRKEIREEKKATGTCLCCSKPATHGIYCYECSIKRKRAGQKHNAKLKIERLERGLIPEQRKADGLCLWCGEPAIPGMQCCEYHRKRFVYGGYKGYQSNLINKNNPHVNLAEYKKKLKKKAEQVIANGTDKLYKGGASK